MCPASSINDISAFSGRTRPAYQWMLEQLKAGPSTPCRLLGGALAGPPCSDDRGAGDHNGKLVPGSLPMWLSPVDQSRGRVSETVHAALSWSSITNRDSEDDA